MATPSQNSATVQDNRRGWGGGGPRRATSQDWLRGFSFVESMTSTLPRGQTRHSSSCSQNHLPIKVTFLFKLKSTLCNER